MFNVHVYVMYSDRTSTIPGEHVGLKVTTKGDPGPGFVDWTGHPVAYVPSFIESYEAISTSVSGPKLWHPFSHYKRFANKTTGMVKGTTHNFYNWVEYRPPELPVYHYWEWWLIEVPTLACWLSDNFGPADIPLRNAPSLYTIQNEELLIPPPNDLDDLLLHASQRILPVVKQELSLINSIIELKDFKSLGHTFNNLSSRLDSISSLLSPKGLSFKEFAAKKTARALVRESSDVYLQYKFNIAPLVSDIQGVFKSLALFKKQANRLVSQSARNRTGHANFSIPSDTQPEWESDSERRFDFIESPVSIFTVPQRIMYLDPAEFHVEIQYSYHYTEFQKQHAALLAFLDKLGVSFDPAIIWNAIPWSFVVDWVVGIGRFLNGLRIPNLEPVIDIHRALWSIKRKRHTVCVVNDNDNSRGVPVSSVREEAYRRSLFTLTPHLIESSGLSLTEVSLAGALLGSRR